jgi:hypothetical protein
MQRLFLRLFALALLTSGAVMAGMTASASADPGMTVAVGSPVSLQSKVVLNVPVTVTCDSLGLGTNIGDVLTMTVQQASGKNVTVGTANLGATGGMLGPGAATLFTCDGSANNLTVPVIPEAGEGPFKGGQAVITSLVVRHSEGSGCSQFFCSTQQSESASLSAPLSIKVKS